MKVKLLKLIRHRAHFCAHIEQMEFIDDIPIGVNITYCIPEEFEYYNGTWKLGMTEKEFDRAILQKRLALCDGVHVVATSRYAIDEVVAIAQSYSDIYKELEIDPYEPSDNPFDWFDTPIYIHPGWNNKMFVRADLMLHHIKITNIRYERLQDISDEDCLKEGIVYTHGGYGVVFDVNYNVLYALNIKPKKNQRLDIKDYQEAAAKRNQKLLVMLKSGYNTMHLYMSYDGDKTYNVSKGGIDTANDIIDWCEANAPQALSGTRSRKRKEREKSKPTLY